MITIELCGATGEVTGSGYLVHTGKARVLVDFGIFQDGEQARERSRQLGPVVPKQLNAVLLTHAHIDHSGRLPLLVAGGYNGRLYATPATLQLAHLLLDDMARIEKEDLKRINRQRRRSGQTELAPLFRQAHVEHLMRRGQPLLLNVAEKVAEGVEVTAIEAGHILGAASLSLSIRTEVGQRTVVFSGDLGPNDPPILRQRDAPDHADLVFLEATYGGRSRPALSETVDKLKSIAEHAADSGGRVVIPAFAVGRTQTILYFLAEAVREGRLPGDFPIYLDSPMAANATDITHKHSELFDPETRALFRSGRLQQDLSGVRVIESVAESMSLNENDQPCIILSAAGMCDGGRVVHHLKHNLWRDNTQVVLVGHMARDSLGRRLLARPEQIEILGEAIAVKAQIHHLEGFSAHADHDELLEWLAPMAASRPRVVLTHGEDDARQALAGSIRSRFDIEAEIPARGDRITLE